MTATGEAERSLMCWAETLSADRVAVGDITKAWSAHGYKGEKTGPIAFGRRGDGAILVAAGPHAEVVWLKLQSLDVHVTRMDLQVTVKFDPEELRLCHQVYREVQAPRAGVGRRPKATIILGSDGGSTCYVGSRQSIEFGRVYNKGIESKRPEYDGCWRYEVEYKAEGLASVLATLRDPEFGLNRIAALVHHYYQVRGHTGSFVPYGEFVHRIAHPPESDSARCLRWLTTQVAPTINTLRRNGYEGNVYEALGLRSPPTGKGISLANDNFGSHGPLE